MEIGDATLSLFFTKGVSLKTWADIGIVDRELALYKKLSIYLKKINLITYGGRKDRIYSDLLGDINVLPLVWRFRAFTILNLILKYCPELKNSDILKTNQINGSEIPLWLKKKFKKKLIVRCGYLHSTFTIKRSNEKKTIKAAIQLEKTAFTLADMGIVTSAWQRDIVLNKYMLDPAKIKVIPNYVLTDVFKPDSQIKKKFDLIFIGRGSEQKNIGNLLKAIKFLKKQNRSISSVMVGSCCFESKIKQMITDYELDVTLKGTIPNFELPKIINQARIFILPSYYEGHPKVLLEAMSCGMPCIGTDVVGIRDDIAHLVTGYLCKTDFKSISNAIDLILNDESLQIRLGRNARNYILSKYSLDKVFKMEIEVIKEVLAS
ncbi:MAG: glycosyltransferase family 4 protein [Promethearchaeota archaeon]|jgi:glycosyltransferase involved in cell wall biosynthesis